MAATGTPTPNIGLRRPQGTDPASVDDINYNSNLIDTKLGAVGNTSVQEQIDSLNSNIANWEVAFTDTSATGLTITGFKNSGLKLGLIRATGSGTTTPAGSYTVQFPSGYRLAIAGSIIAPVYVSGAENTAYVEARYDNVVVRIAMDSTWSAGSVIFPII